MNTRRITLGLGAAAGGLLAAAYLPMGAANAQGLTSIYDELFGGSGTGTVANPFADIFGGSSVTDTGTLADFNLATSATPETILTQSGLVPLDQQVEGTQVLDLMGTDTTSATTPVDLATVNTDVSTLTTPIGFTNTEYTVTGVTGLGTDGALPAGSSVTDLPTVGSTYDVASFDGFSNDYSSIVTPGVDGAAGTDSVSDIFNTPFGSFDITPLIGSFDASSGYLDPTTGLVDTPFVTLADIPTELANLTGIDSLLGVFDPAVFADFIGMF